MPACLAAPFPHGIALTLPCTQGLSPDSGTESTATRVSPREVARCNVSRVCTYKRGFHYEQASWLCYSIGGHRPILGPLSFSHPPNAGSPASAVICCCALAPTPCYRGTKCSLTGAQSAHMAKYAMSFSTTTLGLIYTHIGCPQSPQVCLPALADGPLWHGLCPQRRRQPLHQVSSCARHH